LDVSAGMSTMLPVALSRALSWPLFSILSGALFRILLSAMLGRLLCALFRAMLNILSGALLSVFFRASAETVRLRMCRFRFDARRGFGVSRLRRRVLLWVGFCLELAGCAVVQQR